MRSLLLVSGHDLYALEAALDAGADALAIRLSGASRDRAAARRTTRLLLSQVGTRLQRPLIFVILHDRDEATQQGDLDALMPAAPDGFLLPPAAAGSIARLDARLAVQEALHGLDDRSTTILAAAGHSPPPLAAAELYPGASSRLTALAWVANGEWLARGGPEPGSPGGGGLHEHGRNVALYAAAAARLPAIDAPWPDLADVRGLETAALAAQRDGFTGMFAIDAAQLPTIHAVFAAGGRSAQRDQCATPPDATP